jgi:predicted DCC family thiol-disulfide oxidoreductase YuxK
MDYLVFYDKDCSFCKKWTYRLFRLLGLDVHNLNPSGTDKEVDMLMELNNSWVLKIDNENYYFKYEAFTKLLSLSKYRLLLFVFNNFISRRVGNLVYKKVSNSRSCK